MLNMSCQCNIFFCEEIPLHGWIVSKHNVYGEEDSFIKKVYYVTGKHIKCPWKFR